MNESQLTTIKPGNYQFRPSQFLPWMNVRVFKQSIEQNDKLRVRFAGVELNADKLLTRGQWKAL